MSKEMLEIIEQAEHIDIAFHLERNTYYNTPRLILKDIHLSVGEN